MDDGRLELKNFFPSMLKSVHLLVKTVSHLKQLQIIITHYISFCAQKKIDYVQNVIFNVFGIGFIHSDLHGFILKFIQELNWYWYNDIQSKRSCNEKNYLITYRDPGDIFQEFYGCTMDIHCISTNLPLVIVYYFLTLV